jgi:N-acetylglucosamine malate deacetylase 1
MKVLAIGAHFDDCEIGCGGTLAKHRANGDEVLILVITNSEYHDHYGKLIRGADVALKEGKNAAKILDCELTYLNYPTKEVKFDHKIIADIERVIDEHETDLIYTHWDNDVHQDHQAIAKATLTAGRKVKKILMYQSNMYTNTKTFIPNFYVDISNFFEIKMKSILAHENEVKKFGPGWLKFWENEAVNAGQKFNVSYAEQFQLVKYLI